MFKEGVISDVFLDIHLTGVENHWLVILSLWKVVLSQCRLFLLESMVHLLVYVHLEGLRKHKVACKNYSQLVVPSYLTS